MNLKTTLILLVVLLAIGGAAWLLGRSDAPPPEPTGPITDARQPLLPPELINLKRLDRIEITRPQATYILENTDLGWRMTAPINAPVNPAAITELQGNLLALSYLPGEEESNTPKPRPHRLTLRSGDQAVTLTPWDELGGGFGRVLLDRGAAPMLYTTENTLHHLLANLDPTALLAKRLDTPTALTTQRVEIDSAAGNVVLRKVDGRWYLGETGTDERALSVYLDGFINVPGYLNITTAADITRYEPLTNNNPSAMGFDYPRVTIHYTLMGRGDTEPRTAELRVGSPADLEKRNYFVSYRGPDSDRPVYVVMPWDYATVLVRSADEFRDPRVVETNPGLVKTVSGSRDTGMFEVEVPAEQQGTTRDPMLSALGTLAATYASGYVASDQIATAPIGSLTIEARIDDAVEHLRLFSDPESDQDSEQPTFLVIRNSEAVALRVPAKVVDALFKAAQPQPASP